MMAAVRQQGLVDLADPNLYAFGQPEQVWAELRRHRPVHFVGRSDGTGFWAITRYAEAVRVLKDPATFSSARGMRLGSNPGAVAAAANKMLIVSDPPRHGALRHAMNAVFTPRMVRRLHDTMRVVVTECFDEAAGARTAVEFTDIAARLPVATVCELLGVPKCDWNFMARSTRSAFGEDGGDQLARAKAHADILAYYADLVRDRRRQPREDLVSSLVRADVGGSPLTDLEIYLNCDGLISGGNETTRHATTGGLLALINHQSQWDLLHGDPGLLDSAVAEILRFTSPAMHVLRTVTADVELGGRQLRAGDQVTVWLPSANRDELVFAAPDDFDITRTPNRHLAFGIGEHYCLGSSLARYELAVFFGELVRRFSTAELAGPVRRLSSNLIRGLQSMPVVLTARSDVSR